MALTNFSVLVTGANSGLGFGICCRLIDEFLYLRPDTQCLTLIITTRDQRKSDDTVQRLRTHLRRTIQWATPTPGLAELLEHRIKFQQELVDLTSLRSVQGLGKKLVANPRRIDVVVLNAGIGGWTGVNWPLAFWNIVTDWMGAFTFPLFKMSAVGLATKPQTAHRAASPEKSPAEEPPLGEVFCANLFGHYLLVHYLSPVLMADADIPSRVIWVSTLEAYKHALSLDDFQGLQSPIAYENSKRITDTLALTSRLPSSEVWVKQYFNPQPDALDGLVKRAQLQNGHLPDSCRPKMYLSHPGICQSTIFPLAYILTLLYGLAMYMTRWFGSQWHTCSPYKGACAPVWLALAQQSTLDSLEEKEGVGKWGSACDLWGDERVERTEVEGWGYGGVAGDAKLPNGKSRKGRRKGTKDLTAEDRAEFEELGRKCWQEMESLRHEWEDRLARST